MLAGPGDVKHAMPVSARENAALVRRFLTGVVAGDDLAVVDGFLTDDVIERHPSFEATEANSPATSLCWRVLAATDADVTIEEVVATADRIVARGTVSGNHRDSLLDLAPTGRSFEIVHAWFCRVDDDQISAIWSLPDGLRLLQQIGALPNLPTNRSLRIE